MTRREIQAFSVALAIAVSCVVVPHAIYAAVRGIVASQVCVPHTTHGGKIHCIQK